MASKNNPCLCHGYEQGKSEIVGAVVDAIADTVKTIRADVMNTLTPSDVMYKILKVVENNR